MALLTAQGISQVAIALLERALVLPRTVTSIPATEFRGSNGDTITVRVPQPSAAREQTTPGAALTADDIDEIPVDVTVAHLYHLKNLTDEEATLELEDFARQISTVQVSAVAIGAEDQLATAMNDLAEDATIEFAASATEADTKAAILAARQALIRNGAPPSDLWAAVSPEIATRILSIQQLTSISDSGTPSALRDAMIGRFLGFNFVESAGLDVGTAVFYHRSGFAWANFAPVAPRGLPADQVASTTRGGVSMRQIFQYAAGNAQDQSLVSTFAGAAAVWEDGVSASDNKRFIKVGTGS